MKTTNMGLDVIAAQIRADLAQDPENETPDKPNPPDDESQGAASDSNTNDVTNNDTPAPVCQVVRLPTKNWKGFDGKSESARVEPIAIGDLLRSGYATDVHFTQYTAQYRVNKEGIGKTPVTMQIIAFDVDGSAHKASPEWRTAVEANVWHLLQVHPGGYIYRTKGGLRIVYRLPEPMPIDCLADAAAWRVRYESACDYLQGAFDIVADKACSDFGRVFRAPCVTRDGQPTWQQDYFAAHGDPALMGAWTFTEPLFVWLQHTATPPAPGDGGDSFFKEVVCELVKRFPEADDDMHFAMLDEYYNPRCDLVDGCERWTEAELRHKIIDARAKLVDCIAPNVLGQLHGDQLTTRTIAELAATGKIYERNGELVRIIAGHAPKLVRDAEKTDRLVPLTREDVTEYLAPRLDGTKLIDRVAGWVLNRREWPQMPSIVGVRSLPVIRPDGTVHSESGYDPTTGYFLGGDGLGDSLGEDDPNEAWATLADVFHDFPTVRPDQQSAFVALLLTIIAKPSIEGPTPLTLIEAADVSAGKTLACDVVSTIATGKSVPKREQPHSIEEWPKMLLALLECGYPFALIDNLIGELRTDTLDTLGTATVYSGRRLGSNSADANREVPVASVLALTGNNAKVSRDLAERLVRIRIVRTRPVPDGGWRHPDLLSWVGENRQALFRAAYAVLCGYRRLPAGERAEHTEGLRAMKVGYYDDWTQWVRGPIMWLAGHDVAPLPEDKAELAESDLGPAAIIPALQEVFGDREFTSVDCVNTPGAKLASEDCLPAPRAGRQFDAKYIGSQLTEMKDRVVDGYQLKRELRNGGKSRSWRIVPTC